MKNAVLFIAIPVLMIGNEVLSLCTLAIIGFIAAFQIMKQY